MLICHYHEHDESVSSLCCEHISIIYVKVTKTTKSWSNAMSKWCFLVHVVNGARCRMDPWIHIIAYGGPFFTEGSIFHCHMDPWVLFHCSNWTSAIRGMHDILHQVHFQNGLSCNKQTKSNKYIYYQDMYHVYSCISLKIILVIMNFMVYTRYMLYTGTRVGTCFSHDFPNYMMNIRPCKYRMHSLCS